MSNNATQIASLRDVLENAKGIQTMPAFLRWKADVDGQIKGRTAMILNPCKGHDDLVAQEYAKGEIAGMMLAAKMWELMVEYLRTDIRRLQEESGDVEES